ncbi:hypothetical protein MIR68_010639 [Amoeboaphelidium protococcarum]|nr:hypothetical protein MIR68_010639 [Amoeboaphelidium protococcarum]
MSKSSISALSEKAMVQMSSSYSIKNWLGSADMVKQQAELYKLEGKLESSYVQYLKFCNIITDLKKHPDFDQWIRIHGGEYRQRKKQLVEVIAQLEQLKAKIIESRNSAVSASTPSSRKVSEVKLVDVGDSSDNNVANNAYSQRTPGLNSSSSQSTVGYNNSNKNSSYNGEQPSKVSGMKLTPDKIDATKIYNYLSWANSPNILIIDVRRSDDFIDAHFSGYHLCNIPPELLSSDHVTCRDLELYLTGFHKDNFKRRGEFDLVVYMDEGSTNRSQNMALRRLHDALISTDNQDQNDQTLQRMPALLSGGWQEWLRTCRSAPIKSIVGVEFGNTDGVSDYSSPSPSSGVSSFGVVEDSFKGLNVSAADYLSKGVLGAGSRSYQQSKQLDSGASIKYQPPMLTASDPFNQFSFDQFASTQLSRNKPQRIESPQPLVYYPEHTSALLTPVESKSQLDIPPPLPKKDHILSDTQPSAPAIDEQLLKFQQQNESLSQSVPQQKQLVGRRESMQRRGPSPPVPGSSTSLTFHDYHQPGDLQNISAYSSAAASSISNVSRGMCGLKNLGNTCYMNSILQCLAATRPLSKLFMDGTYRRMINQQNPLGTKGNLVQAFSALLQQMNREDRALSPSVFRDVICQYTPQFRGHEQHDAQEFLAFFLDGLHEDINQGIQIKGGHGYLLKEFPQWYQQMNPKEDDDAYPENVGSIRGWLRYVSRNDSPITELFQGQLKSTLQCSVCGKTSTTYNPFMYLSLPIPVNGGGSGGIRLYDCINEFTKDEILDQEESWRCPQCKVPRRAVKKLTIVRLPPILLVHLKRFSADGMFKQKVENYVDFPVNGLDLFPYLSGSLQQQLGGYYQQQQQQQQPNSQAIIPYQKYSLYAISNHYGGMNGGHYTAFARNRFDGNWYNFDDTHVRQVPEQSIKTPAAYSLFYVSWGFNKSSNGSSGGNINKM